VNDNDDTILLDPLIFRQLSIQQMDNVHEISPRSFLPRILKALANREKQVEIAVARSEDGWKTEENGVLTFRDRVYIPIDHKLREDIIHEHHDSTLAGHSGRYKTAELILREYWWPRLQHDVREYVQGCETCQWTKPHRTPPAAPLHPFSPPARPWDVITVDLIGPLPESQGYNAILVIVDWFSKAIKLEATHLELTSEGFAKILRDRVFRDHGLPRRIIHDRDTRFVSKYMKELFQLLGVEQNPSTAFHPQTDGQTERMNQSIEQYLRTFVNHRQDDWKEWLSIAEFAHNDHPHAATHESPFFVNTGQHPWKRTDTRQEFRNEAAGQFAE
jgi:transposase InsO family protein